MPEPGLATLQRWMSLIVRHPTTSDEGAATDAARALIPRGAVLAGEVVRPSATQQPMQRLDVYNIAYLSRLVDVLETDFGALRHALGADVWRRLAREFVYQNPSHHPNLNGFGSGLPGYVAGRRELPHHAFLAELAELQWAVAEAFHAPEFTPVDFEALQSLPPDRWAAAVLRPNPSVRLLRFSYPVGRYLQAFLEEQGPAVPEPAPTWMLVNRKDGKVWRSGLPGPIHAILTALAAGEPFAAALEAGGEHDFAVGDWFREWSADGVFAAAELPD